MTDEPAFHACPDCGGIQLSGTINALTLELERADMELAQARRQIRALKADQATDPSKHRLYRVACSVLTEWQKLCAPNSREPFSDPRMKRTLARLAHYSEADLVKCIEGYAAFPYMGQYGKRLTEGRPDQRKVDAEYMFRDDQKVLAGLALYERISATERAFQPPVSVSLSEAGQRALRAAEYLGWHVFPCKPNQKQPATRHGLLDAKVDLEAITDYWLKVPDANVAVRCGQESGIVVLDIDGDTGFENLRALERQYAELPKTLSVVTPRGGQHFYFTHPGGDIRNTAGIPAPGIDFRGDGGYVLIPPSVVNGKPYTVDENVHAAPMPDWLLKLIVGHHTRVATKLAKGEWSDLMLEATGEGQRNDTLTRIVGYLLGPRGHSPDEAFALLMPLNKVNFKPPLTEHEVEQVILSIAKREVRKPLGGTA
jgi:hypothetical protein